MSSDGAFTTRPEATEALEEALADVEPDNPVAATRAVARVARRFRPGASTEWEAFRFAAVRALRPYFDARDMDPAKAAAWAVVDPHYGRLEREDDPDKSDRGRDPRAIRVRQALTRGGAP